MGHAPRDAGGGSCKKQGELSNVFSKDLKEATGVTWRTLKFQGEAGRRTRRCGILVLFPSCFRRDNKKDTDIVEEGVLGGLACKRSENW